MKPTTTTIRELRAKAHSLKPVVMIGNNGLTPNVHNEIEQALIAHQLIKIRVLTRDRDYLQTLAHEISDKHQAILVQTMGHIITLYRLNPDKASPIL